MPPWLPPQRVCLFRRLPHLPAGCPEHRGPAATLASAHREPVMTILISHPPPARPRSPSPRINSPAELCGEFFFGPIPGGPQTTQAARAAYIPVALSREMSPERGYPT